MNAHLPGYWFSVNTTHPSTGSVEWCIYEVGLKEGVVAVVCSERNAKLIAAMPSLLRALIDITNQDLVTCRCITIARKALESADLDLIGSGRDDPCC